MKSLLDAGHSLHLIQLKYGGNGQDLSFPGAESHGIIVQNHPTNIAAKLFRILLDIAHPKRGLVHDGALNTVVADSEPDVVILLLARNPKVARNLERKFPTVLIAEEDFSSAWESTSKFGPVLRPLLQLRNRALQRTWPQPDTVMVISDRELAWAKRAFKKSHVVTIPLFLQEEFWLEEGQPVGTPMEIFAIGNFDALRNAFGLRKYLDELQALSPVDTPKVHVACYFPLHPILADVPASRLVFIGRIGDPRPYYYDAKICLSPSLSVSGAKNQILQGWATNCAVVATLQSAESVKGSDGEDLLVGNDLRELASATLTALNDAELRKRLASNGRKSLMRLNSRKDSLQLFHDEIERLASSI
jgi:glycosyltransferase involved in cell wall biosynthesis